MRDLRRSRCEGPAVIRSLARASGFAGMRARHRRQSPVLSGDPARRIRTDHARARPHRHDEGERRLAAAGDRKAVRHRSRLGQGAECRAAEDHGRAPDLPDRSLSRQGDGAEHPGAALRQRHVRADLESQPYRPHPDHGRGEARRRPSRRLLRRHRRAARHGAEPFVPADVAGRDGAAGAFRRAFRALREGRGSHRDPAAEPGGSAEEFGPRAISRGPDRRRRDHRTIARPRTSSPAALPRPMSRSS